MISGEVEFYEAFKHFWAIANETFTTTKERIELDFSVVLRLW